MLDWMTLSAESEFASVWLSGLLGAGVRSVILLALAGAATLALRRAAAAVRHVVWMSAIVSLLALPLLSAALPPWEILPARFASAAHDAPAHSVDTAWVQSVGAKLRGAVREPGEAETAAANGATAHVATSWPQVILAVWAVGVMVVLGRTGLAMLSLRRLAQETRRVTHGELAARLHRLAGELGVTRSLRFVTTDRRLMPMTWGLVRPRLLLPDGARHWPSERLNVVVLHELAHVKRWDCLAELLAQAACARYWFNPLVWAAAACMRQEREQAADDLVLRTGARGPAYATHLLAVASGLRAERLPAAAAIAMARGSRLEERLHAILDHTRDRRPVTGATAFAALIAMSAAAVTTAALRPAAPPNEAGERVVVLAVTWTGERLEVVGPAVWRITTAYGELGVPMEDINQVDLAFGRTPWQEERLAAWIADLGHRDPARRQQASTALRNVGPAAKGALEKVAEHGNFEVRAAVGALLRGIEAGNTPLGEDRVDTAKLLLVGRIAEPTLQVRSDGKTRALRVERIARVRVEGPLRKGVVVTDGSWKASRREVAGWEGAAFDDSAWAAAMVMPLAVGEGRPGSEIAIWFPEQGGEVIHRCFLRRTVQLSRRARHATLLMAADDDYRVYLNGKLVGVDDNGGPTFGHFDRYDVSEHVRPGRNVIAVEAIDTLPVHRLLAAKLLFASSAAQLRALEEEAGIAGAPGRPRVEIKVEGGRLFKRRVPLEEEPP